MDIEAHKLKPQGDIDETVGYRKLTVTEGAPEAYELEEIAKGMENLAKLNFDTDDTFSTLAMFMEMMPDGHWTDWDGMGMITGIKGEVGSWIWVTGDAVDKGPESHRGVKFELGEVQGVVVPEEEYVPPPPPVAVFRGTRSESTDKTTRTVINEGILPGDILLVHHACDDFIANIMDSWPTHAGIAVSNTHAVDANARDNHMQERASLMRAIQKWTDNNKPPPQRLLDKLDSVKSRVVDRITLKKFFADEDDEMASPSGGLVYRYAGGKAREVGQKAADWAAAQVGKNYKFSLQDSPIVAEDRHKGKVKKVYFSRKKKGQVKVTEKRFLTSGLAQGEDGKQHTFYSKSRGENVKTDSHTIYCAELVWRAYRFGANVNIVDPKKFECLYDHSNRSVTGLLAFKLEGESYPSDLAEAIKKGFKRFGKMLCKAHARQQVIKRMREQNSGIMCAPHQLAQTDQTSKVAQKQPTSEEARAVKLNSFRGSNVHPRDVVAALEPANKKGGGIYSTSAKPWTDFVKKKSKPLSVGIAKPWRTAPTKNGLPDLVFEDN